MLKAISVFKQICGKVRVEGICSLNSLWFIFHCAYGADLI